MGCSLPKFAALALILAVIALAPMPFGISSTALADPTPTTVPPESSRITVTYTHAGIPVISVAQPFGEAYVNGHSCSQITKAVVYEAISNQTAWPWFGDPLCSEVGARVRVCHFSQSCSKEFTYTGNDVAVDFPVPEVPAGHILIAHFVHDGVPQTVGVSSWLFVAGGVVCSAGPSGAVFVPTARVSVVGRGWPPKPGCSDPNVTVRFQTLEFGVLETSFTWNGDSVDYFVETGGLAQTPTPSSIPTPSQSGAPSPSAPGASLAPTAAQIPHSGNKPTGEQDSTPTILAALALTLTSAIAWTAAAQRRKR